MKYHTASPRFGLFLGALSLAASGTAAAAEQGEIEEVVVTGSYIAGSAEDAASPIAVTTREDMNFQGNPTIVEMLRNMGPMAGIDGETNQFQSNGLEGISNVNLRGLGAGRTLVLLNGNRVVPSPFFIGQDGQQFVNTNAIPAIALERIEVLKDGASATYGSDAVAGVVNFITRSNFRGIEFQGSFKDVDDADDTDYDIGGIIGMGTDRFDLVVAGGYQFRSQLPVREKDWALNPFAVNSSPGGFSSIGNPGTYFPITDEGTTSFANFFPDPDCETVGGTSAGNFCRFRYTDFDNIVEEEVHYQFMVEGTYQLNDVTSLDVEFLYAHDEVDEWKTSPSYPPQALNSGDQVVVPGMPHFDDFLARNPALAANADLVNNGASVWGRNYGVAGPAQEGNREYDTYRFNIGLEGEFGEIGYVTAFTYGYSEGDRFTNDTRTDNLAYAYRGLGGPNCDPGAFYADPVGSGIVPGQGDCQYYNPFTSGYAVSDAAGFEGTPSPGGDNAALNNSPELYDWLVIPNGSRPETKQAVFDFVLNGESNVQAAGGNVAWAAGFQYRYDDYDNNLAEQTDLANQPCAFGLGGAGESFTVPETPLPGGGTVPAWTYECIGAGALNFLAGSSSFDDDQNVFALFGELAIPFTDTLELQVAARYEDYDGGVGSTFDPKVAARWDVLPDLTLRASLSSSFRAPTLNQLGGEFTALSFVAPALAFKAIDTQGNPDLDPEEAITTNFGVIWQPGNAYLSLDYWNFDFSDPIVLESFNDVVNNCFDATSEIQDLACEKITFQGTEQTGASVQRIAVDYQNGPDIETSGLDYVATYDWITDDWGMFTFGTEGTYISEYEVDSWIWADGFDAEGKLNANTATVRPIADFKNNAYVNWSLGGHNVRLEWFYTGEYDDDRAGNQANVPQGTEIDDQSTYNAHYNFRFNGDNTRIFASVYNFTDEDPPLVLLDLNYDPYTHNALGIMVKVGVQHRFSGGIFQ